MSILDEAAKIGSSIKSARKLHKLSQEGLAKKLMNSRDLIVRMERGDNVGMQNVLAAMNELGLELRVVSKHAVEGSFDDYYEENIGKQLRAEVKSVKDPHALGIFKPGDKPRMRIKNMKQAFNL